MNITKLFKRSKIKQKRVNMMSRVFASAYKKSIYDIGLPREQEAVIWDFYVTKSIASSASQRRAISDYGWKNIPFKEMLSSACILSNNVTKLIND